MFRSRYRLDWRVGNKSLTGNSASGSANLPIEYDFSTLPDGPLPAVFTGATWTISGGAAVNTPTLGPELLTDPGLEASYTAGKCNTLSTAGSPTLAQSADVHGGSKAQEFTGTANANEVYFPFVSLTAGNWYMASLWGKRTATTSQGARTRTGKSGSKPEAYLDRVIDQATYTKLYNVLRIETTGNATVECVNTAASDFPTVVVDDGSLKQITFPGTITSADAGGADRIVRGAVGTVNGLVGMIARLDDAANPQNFIVGYIYRNSVFYYATLEKCVGGTYTTLIGGGGGTYIAADYNYVEGRILEIRCSGSTISLWYNGTQVGADQTVSDAEILSNTRFGMISAGESELQSFFVVAP